MMTINTTNESTDEEELSEVTNPFPEDEPNPLLEDQTHLAGIIGPAIRVELRKTSNPVTIDPPVPVKKRILGPNVIIGLVAPEDLPQEGRPFSLAYHSWNSLSDFGKVSSSSPIRELIEDEDCFYFTADDGQWRVRVLDVGN